MEKKTLGELDDNDLGCYIEVYSRTKESGGEITNAINGILLNYEHTIDPMSRTLPSTKFILSGRLDAYMGIRTLTVQVFNRDNDGNLS